MELFDLFENVGNEIFDYFGETFGSQWGTQEFVGKSIDEACDFFHISEPAAIHLDSDVTAVATRNTTSMDDDVLLFSKEQLQRMGINNKGSVDLVMTHEFTHRMLQGMNSHMDSWDEELCCDFVAGVRAGLNHIDTTELNNALGKAEESLTHPGGEQRVQAVAHGVRFAEQYLSSHNGTPPSFRDCLSYYQETEADSIEMPKESGHVNLRPEHAFVSEAHTGINEFHHGHYGNSSGDFIDDSHLTDGDHGELKGFFVDNRAAQLHHAQEAKENAEWHEKRSNDAIERDDLSAAKDHAARAASYRKAERDAIAASKKCTK